MMYEWMLLLLLPLALTKNHTSSEEGQQNADWHAQMALLNV